MAIPPRTRKRVRANAIPRASDGSAFQNCDMCGNSVAIALADMHECQSSQEVKRFKGIIQTSQSVREERFLDQPRSAFCFFMEKFKITSASVDPIEIDREGFKTWKNMREEKRKPYVMEAARVNFLYDKALRQEDADRLPKPIVEATMTSNWVPDPPQEGDAKLAKKSDYPEEEKATPAKKFDSGCTYHEDCDDSLFLGTLCMWPDV